VYFPTKIGFRVYLVASALKCNSKSKINSNSNSNSSACPSDGYVEKQLTPDMAEHNGWQISWIGVGAEENAINGICNGTVLNIVCIAINRTVKLYIEFTWNSRTLSSTVQFLCGV